MSFMEVMNPHMKNKLVKTMSAPVYFCLLDVMQRICGKQAAKAALCFCFYLTNLL